MKTTTLKSIALKSSLFLIALSIYWLWAGLGFADRINGYSHYQDMESNLNESKVLASKVETQCQVLMEKASPGTTNRNSIYDDKLDLLLMSLLTNIKIIGDDPYVNKNLSLKRNLILLEENCSEITRIQNEYLALLSKKETLISQLTQLLESETNSELTIAFQQYLLSYNPGIISDALDNINYERKYPSPGEGQGRNNSSDPVFLMTEIVSLDYKIGYNATSALTGDIIHYSELIVMQLEKFQGEFRELYKKKNNNFFNRFYTLIFLFGILFLSLLFLFSRSLQENIAKLKYALQTLSRGNLEQNNNISTDKEFLELMTLANSITGGLVEKKVFAKAISEGSDISDHLNFPKDDELGSELDKLAEKLAIARIEDEVHKEDNRIRSWHSEGLAQFGEIFRSERNDEKELAYKVIKMLVEYLNATQGILYIVNDEDVENPSLNPLAAFAFDRRKYLEEKVFFGVGLVGTCALEKESIYVSEVPDDYIQITSGLGGSPPRSIIIVPLKIEDDIFGVIEIASFYEFKDYAIRFIEQLAESISATLSGVRINQKTNLLLEQSMLQSKNMAEQEEIMKENHKAFHKAEEESKRKEHEISSILNAVNASALVAEFSLNGRFSEINDIFIDLLEITKEQVLGKHHSDFAVVEKYSDDYKNFWRTLREGDIIHRTEKYKLFSGNEVWLKQTFTPIKDEKGNIIKILNISFNITQTILQQDTLKGQSEEISRSNIELKSLSNAIDESIIKCEYSPDGIIVDVNNIYCELLGYSMKEMIGKNARIFLKEEEKTHFDTIFSEVLKGKNYSGIVKRSKPTGEEMWLMANFTPVMNEENKVYKIYFLSQDVTEKKLKYQLLEEANKEIDRLKELLENHQKK